MGYGNSIDRLGVSKELTMEIVIGVGFQEVGFQELEHVLFTDFRSRSSTLFICEESARSFVRSQKAAKSDTGSVTVCNRRAM